MSKLVNKILNLLPVKKNKVVKFTPELLTKYNFGLFIINNKASVKDNISYAATVSWKLGYHYNGSDTSKYGMINFLTDGFYFLECGKNKEELCYHLNNNPYGEKYRIMTKSEVCYMIRNRNQGFI